MLLPVTQLQPRAMPSIRSSLPPNLPFPPFASLKTILSLQALSSPLQPPRCCACAHACTDIGPSARPLPGPRPSSRCPPTKPSSPARACSDKWVANIVERSYGQGRSSAISHQIFSTPRAPGSQQRAFTPTVQRALPLPASTHPRGFPSLSANRPIHHFCLHVYEPFVNRYTPTTSTEVLEACP